MVSGIGSHSNIFLVILISFGIRITLIASLLSVHCYQLDLASFTNEIPTGLTGQGRYFIKSGGTGFWSGTGRCGTFGHLSRTKRTEFGYRTFLFLSCLRFLDVVHLVPGIDEFFIDFGELDITGIDGFRYSRIRG